MCCALNILIGRLKSKLKDLIKPRRGGGTCTVQRHAMHRMYILFYTEEAWYPIIHCVPHPAHPGLAEPARRAGEAYLKQLVRGSDTRPMRNGFWLGSLGYTPSVPVLAHRLSQLEQSYLEKWPSGSKISWSRLQHGFARTKTWERICQHTGALGVWEVGQ